MEPLPAIATPAVAATPKSPRPLALPVARLGASIAASTCFLAGCFFEAVLPGPPPPTSPVTIPQAAPPTSPSSPPAALKAVPLTRRLALDLGLRLPSTADAALLATATTHFASLVDAYENDYNLSQALASLHARMWHLSGDQLPDLDGFVASGNTALAASLTPTNRQLIVQEPASYVRYALEQQLPFGSVFTMNQGIVHASLLPLWNEADGGVAFVGEPYRLTTYQDGRPAAGVLASPGLLAAYGSHQDPHLRQRTYRVLQEMLCLTAEQPSAHLFTNLSASELQQDLARVATARADCAGCHNQFEAPAAAFAGLGYGADLNTWLSYAATATTAPGIYGGKTFNGVATLAQLISRDPRLHVCEVKKLLQALYQRQIGDNDKDAFAAALDAFYAGGQSLKSVAATLVFSREYAYAPIGSHASSGFLRQSTGVRFLTRQQWQSVLAALLPAGVTVAITDALDPGHDETLTADDGVPTGAYWHAVDVVARQAAAAIVGAELADGVPTSSRRLLSRLPDGSGLGATDAVIAQQCRDLWQRLTGGSDDAVQTAILQLWSGIAAGNTASEVRRAWTIILTALLSHPLFVSY